MATNDAGSRSSHWCQVTIGSSTTLTISTKTYAEIKAMGVMVVGAWVRKLKYRGRDHFWMFSHFSALLFFSCLDLGPVQMVLAWVFTTRQWRWSFPMHQMRRKVAIELYQSVAGRKISYECVRSRNAHCFLPFPFLFSCTVMHPRWSAPKVGDNVTVTRDCGRVTVIVCSRLATRLSSLAIFIPIHLFTITRVHICNGIPLITIRMPTRPYAGVRALSAT